MAGLRRNDAVGRVVALTATLSMNRIEDDDEDEYDTAAGLRHSRGPWKSRFMVPLHARKRNEAFHEPARGYDYPQLPTAPRTTRKFPGDSAGFCDRGRAGQTASERQRFQGFDADPGLAIR